MQVYISLGWNDYKKHGLLSNLFNADEFKPSPFDTCVSNYLGVCLCLSEDFKHFTNPDYLTVMKGLDGEISIYNERYKFLFSNNHPDENMQNLIIGKNNLMVNHYKSFIEEYNEKINNFRNYLKLSNVTFLITRCQPNIAELINIFNNNYPKLKYNIVRLDPTSKIFFENSLKHLQLNECEINVEMNEDLKNNSFVAYYGIDYDKSINVTLQTAKLFFKNNVLFIEKNTQLNDCYGDPFPFIKKVIIIKYKKNDKLYVKYFKEVPDSNIIIDFNDETNIIKFNKNIIIYPHRDYVDNDGGINVMYYLGNILQEYGANVKMYPTFGCINNNIFNDYYDADFHINDAVIIYCEGTEGNPLNAKHVVRWMLSELGKNVSATVVNTWGKKELVYYFNSELKFYKNVNCIGSVYKMLPLVYINPKFYNWEKKRNGKTCFTYRKSFYHKEIYQIHPQDAFDIENASIDSCIKYFNEFTYFISYDPLTFLTTIAALCGCISIVHPVDGLNKLSWLKTLYVYPYLLYKNLDNLYGVAYGMDDIKWAQDTIHLVKHQWEDIISFYKNMHVKSFVNDINNYEKMINTIENNYFVNLIEQ